VLRSAVFPRNSGVSAAQAEVARTLHNYTAPAVADMTEFNASGGRPFEEEEP